MVKQNLAGSGRTTTTTALPGYFKLINIKQILNIQAHKRTCPSFQTTAEDTGEVVQEDVAANLIDFDVEEVSMTFTKNEEDQEDAFQIPRKELGDIALGNIAILLCSLM